jgi:hypothetical protein
MSHALFITSLITGALSVFFSCVLHSSVSGLHRNEDIKDWLSNPPLRGRQTPQSQNRPRT